jgi:glycosyltransferase involved in cell wall biosynthesis
MPIRLYTLRGLRAEGLQGPAGQLMLSVERLACRCAQRIYCVSESLRQRSAEFGLAPPEKLVVLGSGSSNGVDASRFKRTAELPGRARSLRARIGLPDAVPVIGFVGRLVRDKGIMELTDAFRRLSVLFPELRLLVVGPFEGCDTVPAGARSRIEGDPHVVWTGFLDEVAPAYALMDVLVLPTYREGFPNAPLEAAAMDLPVVATRVTGCVDAVVDGVTGTLVPPRDAKALADAIRTYLLDPELRRRHGKAGRERVVREFQPERIWRALLAEYVSLLDIRRLPVPARAREVLLDDREFASTVARVRSATPQGQT